MMMTFVSLLFVCIDAMFNSTFRWTATPVQDDICFEAMKAGMDNLPPGTKMVLNSGECTPIFNEIMQAQLVTILLLAEFYGFNPPTANLELISRFFEKYPSYVDKAFLVVKVRY